MTIQDIAIRATSQNGNIRAFACVTTNLVREMERRQQSWHTATAALGRTASIAAMMGLMLKNEERLTVQIKGDGPIGNITVDADSSGNVRGYMDNPQVELPLNELGKLDVGGAVGSGMLYVIRDMGLKDYYRGSSEIQTGEIADDFTYYFVKSEQTPSSVAAGVLVGPEGVIVSGGFIIQLMPGHTEEDIRAIEENLSSLTSVTKVLEEDPDASRLLAQVLPDAKILETRSLQFKCNCSHERLRSVLITLGTAELQSILTTQGEAEVRCHFCNEVYHFSKDELQGMIDESASHGTP